MDAQLIRNAETWPKKAGKNDYLRFLKGDRLTQRQAIKAKCYECCCGEPSICTVLTCALQPYNNMIHKNDDDGSASTCIGRDFLEEENG